MGTFVSNNAALAVVALPLYPAFAEQQGDWVLVLDQINDPGNLGTIIRVADWYGIRHILCSPDTVDAFNPKVIASAKGSFLRVRLHYQPLAATPGPSPPADLWCLLGWRNQIDQLQTAKRRWFYRAGQ